VRARFIGRKDEIGYAVRNRENPGRMTEQHDAAEIRGPRAERLRLKGVVDQPAPPAAQIIEPRTRSRNWEALAQQMVFGTRLFAVFFLFAALAGVPLGKLLAYRNMTGGLSGFDYLGALDFSAFVIGACIPILIILIGYVMSRLMQMLGAAEDIASSARQFIHPDEAAAENAKNVGLVVRDQMSALNVGLDGALNRLASVEAMIRKHVTAIEAAGAQIEQQATGAVSRVAEERVRLIELTEHLNTQADAFARAIAEKARASIDALHTADNVAAKAESQLEDRLGRLDSAARQALESFNALSTALASAHENMSGAVQRIDVAALEAKAAAERASKIADAAAEDAARNAANIGASATRAAEEAKRAADASIEAATREAERAAAAAFEAAEREAQRVADVTGRLLGDVRKSTADLIGSVSADADKAQTFAARLTDAAKTSIDASRKASSELAKAREQIEQDSQAALAAAEAAAAKSEARNRSLVEARAALDAENTRLETLIAEQRERADRLADAIASQTERLAKLAEAQLREQEAQLRLQSQARLKAQEEEAARALALAEARAEAERKAAADRKAKEEAERLAREQEERRLQQQSEEAERSAKAEAEKQASETQARAKAARTEKPSLVERAMKSAKEDDGVLNLDKTVRPSKKADGYKPHANGSAKPEETGEAPLTLSGGKAAEAGKRGKDKVSWREILDKTDEAEPLDLAAASKSDSGSESFRIIGELQAFTLDLETRLYGEPPPALKERFDRGDRNVFANRILRLNEADVKRRIRMEADKDRAFEREIHGFLQGFEKLLEDATASTTADEELEEYLSSPLGRVYLLIGAMVGYFA